MMQTKPNKRTNQGTVYQTESLKGERTLRLFIWLGLEPREAWIKIKVFVRWKEYNERSITATHERKYFIITLIQGCFISFSKQINWNVKLFLWSCRLGTHMQQMKNEWMKLFTQGQGFEFDPYRSWEMQIQMSIFIIFTWDWCRKNVTWEVWLQH